MESRERLTGGGVGGGKGRRKEKEGKAVIDCTACVLVVRRMTRGGRAMREEWRAGFAPRAALTALCPPENAPTSLQWAAHWSHWIFDWHTHNQLLLLTPYLTHPPQTNNNVSRADWNSKASLDAIGIDSDGRRGVAVVAHWGPIKNRC